MRANHGGNAALACLRRDVVKGTASLGHDGEGADKRQFGGQEGLGHQDRVGGGGHARTMPGHAPDDPAAGSRAANRLGVDCVGQGGRKTACLLPSRSAFVCKSGEICPGLAAWQPAHEVERQIEDILGRAQSSRVAQTPTHGK